MGQRPDIKAVSLCEKQVYTKPLPYYTKMSSQTQEKDIQQYRNYFVEKNELKAGKIRSCEGISLFRQNRPVVRGEFRGGFIDAGISDKGKAPLYENSFRKAGPACCDSCLRQIAVPD